MLGDLVRRHRLQAGQTIGHLAASAGLSRQHLSEVEAGKRQVGIKTFLLLAALVTIPAAEWVYDFLAEETRLHPMLHVARYLIDKGEHASALLILERVRSLSNVSGRYQGPMYHQMGRYLYETGHENLALRWFRSANRAASRSSDPRARAVAAYNFALSLMSTGYLSASLAKFDQAIVAFGKAGCLIEAGYARLHKANVLVDVGSFREALSDYRRAAYALRDDRWYFDCKLGEGICLWQVQSPAVGLDRLAMLQGKELPPDGCAKLHHNLGVLYRHTGDLNSARRHLRTALNCDTNNIRSRAATLAELSLNLALSGLRSEATGIMREFDALPGPKEPLDMLSMAVLSSALGTEAILEMLTVGCTNDYEHRLSASVSLMLRHGTRSLSMSEPLD